MHDDTDPDDDWAPLPAEKLVVRPGEVEAPAPPPAKMPRPATPRPRRRPTPEGERAFAELQQRLLAMPPSDSIVAEMQRREQREARRRDGRARAGEQLAATVVAVDEVVEPAPELEFDEGHSEVDPRELEPWFQGLPETERERLRETWAAKRDRFADQKQVQRRVANRRTVAALLCFAAVFVLGSHAMWHVTFGAGIVCGIWWRHAPPDRMMDPIRAAVCMIGLQCVALLAFGAISPTLGFDCVLLVGMTALVGFDGEIKRSGGFSEL